MIRHHTPILAGLVLATSLLAGCSGGTVGGTPSTAAGSTSAAPGSSDEVPKIANPLPATVLAGNPCDALTSGDISRFLGDANPAQPGEDQIGPNCRWTNASRSGAGVDVSYQTKAGGGLSLAYKNVKPVAQRFDELDPVQGYPAVGYLIGGKVTTTTDAYSQSFCEVVVGIRDDLAYSISLSLGDSARGKKDPCDVGRNIADAVLTNLRTRS
jgi:Protein of unknown function (DUF3558)